jgi:predicted ester cyclase
MTPDQNKTLVRRYYEEVFNSGDISRLKDFVSPDYTEIYNQKADTVGIDGARTHVLGVRNTYPDIHLKINRQIAEGGWVLSEVHMQGTHTGEWLGIKPTGKMVKITAINMDKIIDE